MYAGRLHLRLRPEDEQAMERYQAVSGSSRSDVARFVLRLGLAALEQRLDHVERELQAFDAQHLTETGDIRVIGATGVGK